MSKHLRNFVAIFSVVLLSVTQLCPVAFATDDEAVTSPSDLIMIRLDEEQSLQSPIPDRASIVTFAASLAALESAVDETTEIRIPTPLTMASQEAGTELAYSEVPIFIDGLIVGDVLNIDGTVYVPVGEFLTATGIEHETSWDQASKTASFDVGEFSIDLIAGTDYIEANGRALPTGDIINVDGTMIAPLTAIAYCFGFDTSYDAGVVRVITDNMSYLVSGDEYYNEDDLYWLSRIVHSESGNQPLDGRIGVGNVVMNRVIDPTCPDTIYDVIFDNEYGVQFSVTENGTIYLEPAELSVVAAKLCLEGRNVVGDSLYFVNPQIGVSSWFANTRVFVASIGEHDFYA